MILEQLEQQNKLTVITNQPICIYTKTKNSYSECYDHNMNSSLDVKNIDESYQLDVVNYDDSIAVYIPRNAKCTLYNTYPNSDCGIIYKNIECDLIFEDEPIDNFFTVEEV